MKRALKKREKAVLENIPSNEGAPVEPLNAVHPRVNRRVPTKAAMIGLAISMGATSFLATRQNDQVLAAEPVANQNTASTISAASDTEVKFAPTKSQDSRSVSSVSVPENHAIVEPTAISQVSGLGVKWRQVAASEQALARSSASVRTPNNPNSAKISSQRSQKLAQLVQKLSSTRNLAGGSNTSISLNTQPQTASTEVNAQLKAQQEFALNSLQEKSDRLRNSLAKLRAKQTKDLPQAVSPVSQPTTVAPRSPQPTQLSATVADASKAKLVAKLKQKSVEKIAEPLQTTSAVVAPSTLTGNEATSKEALGDIASNYGTSVSELVKANGLANPNQLPINQKLTFSATENRNITNQTPVATTGSLVGIDRSVTGSIRTPVNTHQARMTESSPANSPANTPTQAENVNIGSYHGMGGDSPIPQAIMDMQAAGRQSDPTKTTPRQNSRLRSLQAEIDRLREKYRAQQSGSPLSSDIPQTNTSSEPIPVSRPNTQAVSIPVSRPNTQAVSIPVSRPNTQAVSIPVSRPNTQAVSIPVPNPMELNYGAQPTRPQVRSIGASEDAINPEFVPNGRTNIATPSGRDLDASQSLGHLRGTVVSPGLPPLAAVDRYLPKPIDETTTFTTGYIWPAKGVLTSGFGMRWGRMHKGIDVANSTGSPIYASADGVVEKAGWNNGGYGNLVDIRHADGTVTRYGHNSKILVHVGQQVRQGEIIAAMGSTGFSTGPHSHFEVHPGGKGAVNPIAFLPRL